MHEVLNHVVRRAVKSRVISNFKLAVFDAIIIMLVFTYKFELSVDVKICGFP